MKETLWKLKTQLAQVHDLRRAASVLSWDREVNMPPGGAVARARQMSTLRRLAHERFSADELGVWLEDL